MLVLQFNQLKLKEELPRIPSGERAAFKASHENALSYQIEGTTTNKSSLYNFEQRLKHIKIMVVQHVQDCLTAITPTQREKSLFASAQANSGAVSQDANLRVSRRLYSIVSPLLAKNSSKRAIMRRKTFLRLSSLRITSRAPPLLSPLLRRRLSARY
jgi:hypothetical protein